MKREEFLQSTLAAAGILSFPGITVNRKSRADHYSNPRFKKLFNGRDLTGFINVNTSEDTWKVQDGILVCSGNPIGVMRTEKQYENY